MKGETDGVLDIYGESARWNGEVCGAWKPGTRWLDTLNNMKGPSINIMRWDARDRAKWRSATAVVARERTRLGGTG